MIASAASCVSLRPAALENSVCPMPTIAVASRSRLSTDRRPWLEDGDCAVVTGRPEVDRHSHPDSDVTRVDIDQIRQHANALVEIDKRGQDGIIERRVLRVAKDGVAVDDAVAREVDQVEFERVADRAHRARRVTQTSTAPTLLRDQPSFPCRVPIESVVVIEERGGASDLASLGHCAPSRTARLSTIASISASVYPSSFKISLVCSPEAHGPRWMTGSAGLMLTKSPGSSNRPTLADCVSLTRFSRLASGSSKSFRQKSSSTTSIGTPPVSRAAKASVAAALLKYEVSQAATDSSSSASGAPGRSVRSATRASSVTAARKTHSSDAH